MSEIAAKAPTKAAPKAPTRPRRRLIASRLVPYLLLQALIVIATILGLRLLQPNDPDDFALSGFSLRQDGVTLPVNLPHFTASRYSLDDPPIYTGSFTFRRGEAASGWSVYLPRFSNAVGVAVDGVVVLDSRRDANANRPDRNTPQIAAIPASLLREGANEITVRLFVWGPLKGFLDTVYVGPDAALRPAYETRTLLFVTLPVVFSAWQSILAVILAIMWLMRRREPVYGVLAAAMVLGVVQAYVPPPVPPAATSRLAAVLLASAPIESALVVMFGVLFFGWRWPRYGMLLFVPGLVVFVVGLIGGPPLPRILFLVLGIPTVGLCLVLMAWVTATAVVRRQDAASFTIGCAVTIVLVCWIQDMLTVLEIVSNDRIFVSRLSYSAMLVAIGAGLTWRFARALNQVDSFAGQLVTRVREAEERLKASFVREEERARAAALANERTRLMRDLHDGLGGQLVSIVALSERGHEGATITDAARAALKDLRLVIDSMDDIGGDLMLALGSWRERASAQLRPHDITLDWRVATPQGLPLHPELRPWHVIQIVRILDEAVTNAVKHAQAHRIAVTIETLDASEGPYGLISVTDDGQGFALAGHGEAGRTGQTARGLRNMRNRAARCGALLDLSSDASGTRVRLQLPQRFPDSDAAAG
ncbi:MULTISPECIES: sensor histidine kinase [Bradyrhizobium]|uniref:Signal transduction histidine kinase n=2 Tax=Bradyrhizobium TaxID=374 RepID=A0ABV4FPF2_9BRAD|nr:MULTISPECIES: ATP-binding protein [Bradyrhizobium]MBR1290896.1 ATP-binding protein [Bradyrhizobium ottawaense]MDA9417510.1 histidine kinase [Bradyrhizobium sp. CCBAU 25360]MDA9485222.1 histidine kinase [Bradyrhizobium sp. CCBAU 11445]PDT66323.1 ATP-binding protein [Bradyrhizobium ottawaense]WLB45481.1 ATP-binding protein [Bradyrhizobium ottawaense]